MKMSTAETAQVTGIRMNYFFNNSYRITRLLLQIQGFTGLTEC